MQAILHGSLDIERIWADRPERTVTTLLVARLSCGTAHDHLCRIRNFSEGGMMIETLAPIAPGVPVSVEPRGGERFVGKAVWREGERAGVQFDAPIDVERVLSDMRVGNGAMVRPRSPRFAIECPAQLNSFGRMIDVTVEDVSQSGACVRMAHPPRTNAEVILAIPGLPPRRCTTRWSREDKAGLFFHDTISYRELAAWLEHRGSLH